MKILLRLCYLWEFLFLKRPWAWQMRHINKTNLKCESIQTYNNVRAHFVYEYKLDHRAAWRPCRAPRLVSARFHRSFFHSGLCGYWLIIIKLIRLTKALRLFLPWWFLNSIFNRTAREASRLLSFSGWRSISTLFISPTFSFSIFRPSYPPIISPAFFPPLLRFAFFQAASSFAVSHPRQVGRGKWD